METETAGGLLFCRPRPVTGRRSWPSGPLSAGAECRWKHGGTTAFGTISEEGGALVFRGDAFDFRLSRKEIPLPQAPNDFLRGVRLNLPGGGGVAILRITVEERDREALRRIASRLTAEAEPIFPPLYRIVKARDRRMAWWLVALVILFLTGSALGEPSGLVLERMLRNWPLVLLALIAIGVGLRLNDPTILTGEPAFRKLQAQDAATP